MWRWVFCCSFPHNHQIHNLTPGTLMRMRMWLTREPDRCPAGPQQTFSKGCFALAPKPIHTFTSGNVNFKDFFLLFPKCQAQADKLLDELLQISPQRSWITSGRQWVLYFRTVRMQGVSLRKPCKMVYCQAMRACLWLSHPGDQPSQGKPILSSSESVQKTPEAHTPL